MGLPAGSTLTIESKYTPPITFNLSDQGPEPQSLLVRVLKPKVTFRLSGTTITSIAPAGEPVPNEWPKTRWALVIAGGLAVIGLLKLFR